MTTILEELDYRREAQQSGDAAEAILPRFRRLIVSAPLSTTTPPVASSTMEYISGTKITALNPGRARSI